MNTLKSLTCRLRDKGIESGLFFMAVLTAAPRTVGALLHTSEDPLGSGAGQAQGSGQDETSLFEDGGIFQTITNFLLFLVGAISVIMLIIGGFKYVISGGDSTKVESAKNTIIYAIVGIVVAFLAWAAVDFVIETLQGE